VAGIRRSKYGSVGFGTFSSLGVVLSVEAFLHADTVNNLLARALSSPQSLTVLQPSNCSTIEQCEQLFYTAERLSSRVRTQGGSLTAESIQPKAQSQAQRLPLPHTNPNSGPKLQVLKALHEKPDITQRELAEQMGVSLGQVNYCVKALVDKGHVKVGNFAASGNKLGYVYLLTPSGVAEKARLTAAFIERKLSEYKALHAEISALVEAGELHPEELPRPRLGESRY